MTLEEIEQLRLQLLKEIPAKFTSHTLLAIDKFRLLLNLTDMLAYGYCSAATKLKIVAEKQKYYFKALALGYEPAIRIILEDYDNFFRNTDFSVEKQYIHFLKAIREDKVSLETAKSHFQKTSDDSSFKLLAACEILRVYPADKETKEFLTANKAKWPSVIGCYREEDWLESACLQGDMWALKKVQEKNHKEHSVRLPAKRAGYFPLDLDYESDLAVYIKCHQMHTLIPSLSEHVYLPYFISYMLEHESYQHIPYGAFCKQKHLADDHVMHKKMLQQAQKMGHLALYCYDLGPLASVSGTDSNVIGLKIEILIALADGMMQRQWYKEPRFLGKFLSLLQEVVLYLIKENSLKQRVQKSYPQIMRLLAKLQVSAGSDLSINTLSKQALDKLFPLLTKEHSFIPRWTLTDDEISLLPSKPSTDLMQDLQKDTEEYVEAHDPKDKTLTEMRYHKDMALLLLLTLAQNEVLTPARVESIRNLLHKYSEQSDSIVASLARSVSTRDNSCEKLVIKLIETSPVLIKEKARAIATDVLQIKELKNLRQVLLKEVSTNPNVLPLLLRTTGEFCYLCCVQAKKTTDLEQKIEYLWEAFALGYEPAAHLLLRFIENSAEEDSNGFTFSSLLTRKPVEVEETEMVDSASNLHAGLEEILKAQDKISINYAQRSLWMFLQKLENETDSSIYEVYVCFLMAIRGVGLRNEPKLDLAEKMYQRLEENSDFKLLAAGELWRFYEKEKKTKCDHAEQVKSYITQQLALKSHCLLGCYGFSFAGENTEFAHLQQDWWTIQKRYMYILSVQNTVKDSQSAGRISVPVPDIVTHFSDYVDYAIMYHLAHDMLPFKPPLLHFDEECRKNPYASFRYAVKIEEDFALPMEADGYEQMLKDASNQGDLDLYFYDVGPLTYVQVQDWSRQTESHFLRFKLEILLLMCNRVVLDPNDQKSNEKFGVLLQDVIGDLSKKHNMDTFVLKNYFRLMLLLAKLQLIGASDLAVAAPVNGQLELLSSYDWIRRFNGLSLKLAQLDNGKKVDDLLLGRIKNYFTHHTPPTSSPRGDRYDKDMALLVLVTLLQYDKLTTPIAVEVLSHFAKYETEGTGVFAAAGRFLKSRGSADSCAKLVEDILQGANLQLTDIKSSIASRNTSSNVVLGQDGW